MEDKRKGGKGFFEKTPNPLRLQANTVSPNRFLFGRSPHSFPPPCLDSGGGAEVGPPCGPARLALASTQSRLKPGPNRAMSAKPELIELQELASSGCISPGRTRLERANALRISPGTTRNSAQVLGRGHRFQPAGPATHTWCDLCGDFIWGVVRKGLQCACE